MADIADDPSTDPAGVPVGRRAVLGMLWLGALGVVWGDRLQTLVARLARPLTGADPSGIAGLFPGTRGFRIYSVVGSLPRRSDQAYRLHVGGLVDRPMEFDLSQLRSLPSTKLIKDFQCVTGWRVTDVPWRGVLLRDMLELAGVQDHAEAVVFRSFDGIYTETLTIDQARRPDVLVAYDMLDKPVNRAHGGPVRLYVAPMYGYKSCKWLGSIEVTGRVSEGFWEQRGYDINAWIGRSNGRDDQPVN